MYAFCSKEELWEAAKEEEMKIPLEGREGGGASTRRSVSRKILATKTRRNWLGHGKQRIPSHRIQTNTRCEKQLCGKGDSSRSGAVHKFANGSPSGRSSQRVEGTTTCVVGGTCGSVHVESFNKNMKALGVLESEWDPIRQKLVRRLLEEQDKVLRA